MPLVIDASVALSFLFADEDSVYADRIMNGLSGGRDVASVPIIWRLEVVNGVLQSERRRRSTQADSERVLVALATVPVAVDIAPTGVETRTLSLAREHNLTVYDAAYLELALREGLPLATLDGDLRAAATRVGVTLVP